MGHCGKVKQLVAFCRSGKSTPIAQICVDNQRSVGARVAVARGAGLDRPKTPCSSTHRSGSWFLLGELLLPSWSWMTMRRLPRIIAEPVPAVLRRARRAVSCPGGSWMPAAVSRISTIELRGEVPAGLRKLNWRLVFGCDCGQESCPWNRFARPTPGAALCAYAQFDVRELAEMTRKPSVCTLLTALSAAPGARAAAQCHYGSPPISDIILRLTKICNQSKTLTKL